MDNYEWSKCAICGDKPFLQNYYFCTRCYHLYNHDEDWVQSLVKQEKERRKAVKLEKKMNVLFVDWSDESITFTGYNDFMHVSYWEPPEYSDYEISSTAHEVTMYLCLYLSSTGILSQKEADTLYISMAYPDLDSEEAAVSLSEIEGDTVSASTYRKRKSRAFKKIEESNIDIKETALKILDVVGFTTMDW